MGEQVPKFESFQEFEDAKRRVPTERPLDIEIGGRVLGTIEKNPIQQEAVTMAVSFVQEHLQELGVYNNRGTFDPRRITFINSLGFEHGAWHKDDDWIFVSAPMAEANLNVLQHEILHMAASEWRYKDEEDIGKRSTIRPVKTGFSTTWLLKQENNQMNFVLLNEAITEKIAREITLKHKEAAEALPKKYPERLAQHLAKAQQYIDGEMVVAKVELERKKKQYDKQEEEELQKIEEQYIAHVQEAKTDPDTNPELLALLLENAEYFRRESIKMTRDTHALLRKSAEDFLISVKMIHEAKSIKQIQEAWEKPLKFGGYQGAIDILDVLLEGVTLYRAKEKNQSYEEVHAEVWRDMQRAYFNGQTVWLRVIEKVFGEGMLREIGKMFPNPFVGLFGTDNPEVRMKEKLQKKVAELRSVLLVGSHIQSV